MEPYEWAYWMEGKPAAKDIKAPDGDAARQGRHGARRRLLRAAHGRRRVLERGDGRERLHGPEVERVHRGLSARRDRPAPRCATASAPRSPRCRSLRRVVAAPLPLVLAAPSAGCRPAAGARADLRRCRSSRAWSASGTARYYAADPLRSYQCFEVLAELTCVTSEDLSLDAAVLRCWSGLITLVLGFAVAYFLAFHVRSPTMQIALFLVCTIPFWTSNVIRMISWVPLLGRNGAGQPGAAWRSGSSTRRSNGCSSRTSRWCSPSCTSTRCS